MWAFQIEKEGHKRRKLLFFFFGDAAMYESGVAMLTFFFFFIYPKAYSPSRRELTFREISFFFNSLEKTLWKILYVHIFFFAFRSSSHGETGHFLEGNDIFQQYLQHFSHLRCVHRPFLGIAFLKINKNEK